MTVKVTTDKRSKPTKTVVKQSVRATFKKSSAKAREQQGQSGAVTGQFLNRVILDAPVKLSAKERAEVKELACLMRA